MNLTDVLACGTALAVMAAATRLGALPGFARELMLNFVAARPSRQAARAGGRIR